jgi:hypothetical protein
MVQSKTIKRGGTNLKNIVEQRKQTQPTLPNGSTLRQRRHDNKSKVTRTKEKQLFNNLSSRLRPYEISEQPINKPINYTTTNDTVPIKVIITPRKTKINKSQSEINTILDNTLRFSGAFNKENPRYSYFLVDTFKQYIDLEFKSDGAYLRESEGFIIDDPEKINNKVSAIINAVEFILTNNKMNWCYNTLSVKVISEGIESNFILKLTQRLGYNKSMVDVYELYYINQRMYYVRAYDYEGRGMNYSGRNQMNAEKIKKKEQIKSRYKDVKYELYDSDLFTEDGENDTYKYAMLTPKGRIYIKDHEFIRQIDLVIDRSDFTKIPIKLESEPDSDDWNFEKREGYLICNCHIKYTLVSNKGTTFKPIHETGGFLIYKNK